jgi:CRISPR-associated endonuclease/helicase Cas3
MENMPMEAEDFKAFFAEATGRGAAHSWQVALGASPDIGNRLIRVPTGFGKTLGVLTAWTYNRVVRKDVSWPRRLVWCLPMRTLVEQTSDEIRRVTEPYHVSVHTLMGGTDAGEWHLHPERNAVLVGTQDMLISRALNRGYAAPRARWPMEFGLLNCDCLWIIDEVQLMDVGLATSAQLQQFREEERQKTFRPSYTWWMSATLQPEWLESVDTRQMVAELRARTICIPTSQRTGRIWDDVCKSVTVTTETSPDAVAAQAIARHTVLSDGDYGRITLVVLNRVDRAVDTYEELLGQGRKPVNTFLLHSRFRGAERQHWRDRFLSRSVCRPGADLILVATQVVEAGVDISAGCLLTDLAPWPSLVQRFGRAARYGGHADIVVLDHAPADDKNAAPYDMAELDAAREALTHQSNVSPKALEDFEVGLTDEARKTLYPYDPRHLFLRKEMDELFDTTADLTGADLDVSRFIRTGQERDCQVFWADWDDGTPPATLQPAKGALCAVPFYGVHTWLFKGDNIKDNLKAQVFVWDYLDDAWRPPQKKDIYPGRLVLVRSPVGGYSVETGFTGAKPTRISTAVPPVATAAPTPDDQADSGADNDVLSEAEHYQPISAHGAAVAAEVGALASALELSTDLTSLLVAAGRYHDLGKVHPAFRCRINPSAESGMQSVQDLAKAPQDAWRRTPTSIRHELASALALMELLARTDQNHPALLGACQELIEAKVMNPEGVPATPLPASLAAELRSLTAEQFNLLIYLVCAHHGKVRAALHACPADQDTSADDEAGMPIRGIKDGDLLPPVRIRDAQGAEQTITDLDLHLAPALLGLSCRYGPSWRERTLALQTQFGPFALAWLEAILRTADIRTSRKADA